MSEEQKEYEAMQLVNLMDEMQRQRSTEAGARGETEYILYLLNSSSNEGFLGSIEVTIWSEYLPLMSTI